MTQMTYYSAVLLWPQQVQALFTTDIIEAGWLSVRTIRHLIADM